MTRKDDFKELVNQLNSISISHLRSMRSFADDYMEIFDRILRTFDITETEFHAMIVILVCQLGETIYLFTGRIEHISDTMIALADSIQNEIDDTNTKIFSKLQSYYRDEMGLVDFSSRLGRVMSMSTAFSVSFH